MTHEEYKSHFSLWAALKSPLILGNDVANMTVETALILKNEEVIAVNQDALGKSVSLAYRLKETGRWALEDNVLADVWTGPLEGGDLVAGMLFAEETQH